MESMSVVEVKTKSVYGKDLMYVVSDNADTIKKLTGKKTVDRRDIAALIALGCAAIVDGKRY